MRSVLVTGGTGSFGQAFVRRVLADSLADRICVYSRGEHAQAAMAESVDDPRVRWFIGDVRDRDRLTRAMAGCDTVVHAAALKRIEVGAYNPVEMVRTNVDGAINVVHAAIDAGVARVVGLSSDKAWQPKSPYGQSKALGEAIFLASNRTVGRGGPRFVVTRYGNVAGSAGSVIPRWRHMLASGRDVLPVTDPECTRFWMSMSEAVDLVLTAVESVDDWGEPIIPDWLPAYRLADLAQAMGARDITVTGLPAYEKAHEGMRDGLTSDKARRLSVDELRALLAEV